MNEHSEIAIEESTGPMVGMADPGATPVRVRPGTVLLLAVWIGLIAGFLDLGLLVVNKRLLDRDFFRLGGDFPWIIPTGVTILVLVPAMVLVLIARISGGTIRLGVAVWALSAIGFLDLCARLPLEPPAALLLSGGLATQFVRMIRPRRAAFVRLVRRSVPMLAAMLVTITLVTIGRRAWFEHRATSALPPPPAGARNVLLIVWDTVRPSNLSLHGYDRPTTPNLDGLAGRGVRFDLAFSSSSWTLPSHASMFTGRWPHELGVDWKSPLRDDVPTLAEYLSSHGYDTAGFAANLDYCSRETGLGRGMLHYEDFPIDVYDAFSAVTSHWAIGSKSRPGHFSWTWSRRSVSGVGMTWCPAPGSTSRTPSTVNRAFLGWLGRRRDRAPSLLRLPELQRRAQSL